MLEQFFTPRSVAVIGAAREEGKLGYSILHNVIQYGYKGGIFPVNPKADEILGLKCYPNVTLVPGEVDLAIIVVPRDAVATIIKDCGVKGIKGAIIITAGFREVGGEGLRAEKEVMEIAGSNGLRLLGPNCLGLIDTYVPINATFAASMPEKGNISFMSQSGALFSAILDWASAEEVGFAKFVSLGNKADIDEIDLLKAWGEDPITKVIIGYLEGIEHGRRFMDEACLLTKRKPVIMIKSGLTSAGSRAVSSHTGTLAGSEAAYNAAFSQSGVIRAKSIEELFDLSIAFADQPLPKGNRVAIVTNAGGPGIMATDACETAGLQLSSFSSETIELLRSHLPPTANLYNPIDVIGDAKADRYRYALEAAVNDSNVDSILVLLTPQATTEIVETARIIVDATTQTDKTIIASFMGGVLIEPGIKVLRQGMVPNYLFPERAVEALAAMVTQREWAERPLESPVSFEADKNRVNEVFDRARREGRMALGDVEAREVLRAYGFKVPKSQLARTPEEAIEMAQEIGFPVVMKIVSPDILHKSDVGGVVVGVDSTEDVADNFDIIIRKAQSYLPEARIIGVTVEEMVKAGKEVILGISSDAQFGHLLMFGLGGIYVEVLKDVSFRVAPISRRDAWEMIRQIRSFPLLSGVRGEDPSDLDSIVDSILRLSQLTQDFPAIRELDVNPLMVQTRGSGAMAVDCRLAISPNVGQGGESQ